MPKSKNAGMNYTKLPGSHRQRNRARLVLKCIEESDNTWIVSGGEDEHLVVRRNGVFLCDCHVSKAEKICSHVIKVQMVLGIFPEPTLVKVGEK